jgi:hypothetical protein
MNQYSTKEHILNSGIVDPELEAVSEQTRLIRTTSDPKSDPSL